MPRNFELNQLLESIGRDLSPGLRAERFGDAPFADTIGFHLYGELSLTLKLTAATDTQDARRLLKILQEYTLIAEACASEGAAVLLEVQGERIHLLIPAREVNANSVAELLRFCVAFTSEVYSRIGTSAGKEFQGFKMAADHGRAILITSGNSANGSIVSLGPPANAPAKELKKNGIAAHLRMRTKHYALVQPQNSSSTKEWLDVPVMNPTGKLAEMATSELRDRFTNRSGEFLNEIVGDGPDVTYADENFINWLGGGSLGQAIKVQGFPLRADLDGFSKDVEDAFTKGDTAIIALVLRFKSIMQYPNQFRARVGRTIDLPWAGDCATVVVLPGVDGYAASREFLPVKAASEWHGQKDSDDLNKTKWSNYLGKAKWAVGIAGGDDKEGSGGYVLIAPLRGRNRDFLVAAGWAIGLSLDAQESDGVAGSDTVIPTVDYQSLDKSHGASFKELNTIFWISHGLTPSSLRSTGISSLISSSPIFVPNISKSVPQPRPWYGDSKHH